MKNILKKSKFLFLIFLLVMLTSIICADNYTDVPTPEPIEPEDPFDWNNIWEEEYEEPVNWEDVKLSESLDWEEPVVSVQEEPLPPGNLEYEISIANGAIYGVGLNAEEGMLEISSIASIEPANEDYFGSWADFDIDFEISTANGAIFGEGLQSDEGPPKIEALATMEPVIIPEKTEEEKEQEKFEISTANGAIFGESLSGLDEKVLGGISQPIYQNEEFFAETEKKGAQVSTPSGSQAITSEGATLATPNYDGTSGTKPGAQVLLPVKDKKDSPDSGKTSVSEPVVTISPAVTPLVPITGVTVLPTPTVTIEPTVQPSLTPASTPEVSEKDEKEKKGVQVSTPSGSQAITSEGATLATPNYDGTSGTKPGAQVLLPEKDKKDSPDSGKTSVSEPVVTISPAVTPLVPITGVTVLPTPTVTIEPTVQPSLTPASTPEVSEKDEKEKKGAQVSTPSGSQAITSEGATLSTPNYDGTSGTKPGAQVLLPEKGKKDSPDSGKTLVSEPVVTTGPAATPTVSPSVAPVVPTPTPSVTTGNSGKLNENANVNSQRTTVPTVVPTVTSTPAVLPSPTVTIEPTIQPSLTPTITPEVSAKDEREQKSNQILLADKENKEITTEEKFSILVTPEPTETPGVGEDVTPEPTETPVVGEEVTPEPTETPVVGEEVTPEPTETPGVSEDVTPEPTKTPGVSEDVTPEPTKTPAFGEEVTPEPTETPVVGEEVTPEPTETPVVGEEVTPEPTETPVVGEDVTPEPTETPVVGEDVTPEPTVTPGIGEDVTHEPTETPGSGEDVTPEPTETPGSGEDVTPEPTETPGVSEDVTPEPTETPGVSEDVTPEPTKTPAFGEEVTPEPTETPVVGEEVTPEPTETPELGEEVTPEPTATPELGEKVTPEPTETPEVGEDVTPEPTETPGIGEEVTPEPTETPGSGEDVTPEPTETPGSGEDVTPEPTETPGSGEDVTPEPVEPDNSQIKPIITPNPYEGLISKIPEEYSQIESGRVNNGIINLMEQPENVEVYINGEPQGLTPLYITGVNPGKYLITFEHEDGYEDQIVEVPESGGEVKPNKTEPIYKISVLAGEKEPCKDCCTIQEVHARTSTMDYSEVFKISTIAMKNEESDKVPYTLYWNGKPWYKGTLKPDDEEKPEGCKNCTVMEDYIREVAPPGTFELKVDDGRLCTSSDNKGRLSFYGIQGIPISSST